MDKYRERAELLRAMGHPLRLQILDILRHNSECVCHLSAALGKSQPYISQQLAVLRNAGIVADEKEGTNSFYCLADERVAQQVAAIVGLPAEPAEAGDGACHHTIKGCICPKCRHTDPSSPC